jgi:large subunit ribosomal protein L6
MSRIGKLPITIPENVDVNCNESEIIVKGKFGTLQTKIPDVINITQTDGNLSVGLKEQKTKCSIITWFISNINQ